ncbi:MAG: hypothetical protein ACLP22_13950 [Solirubrobacteraceae bacterium]
MKDSLHSIEGQDPRADQVRRIPGPTEPLDAGEQLVVVLVRADAVPALERARDRLIVLGSAVAAPVCNAPRGP